MNKDQVISNMIAFIENTEKDIQASRLTSETKASKNEIVNSILNKLDKEVENED